MCGIAGIFAYHVDAPPLDRDELLRIREAMITRGPDAAGLWISGNQRVGMTHRRLSIIDLSEAGLQPMSGEDGKLRIVFNGEIYNYKTLRAELERKGYCFHSQSDTEVLLNLYADRGPDLVHALRGMYAFAIWDENKKGLLLARDPFGIKPLYYADNGNSFRFASQVKALLRSQKIDTQPNPAGQVGFFLWGSVPDPYTLYKGIHALPAGSTLWVSEVGSRQPAPFFNIARTLSAGRAACPASREEGFEYLRAALLDSVQHHLVADVPVGVFLSAGLDSTTLTALAAESSSMALHTATLGFNGYRSTENDETILAVKVADQYHTTHHTRWVSREDFLNERERLLKAMDQPTIDGVNTYFVSKAAAESGLKVAISGIGGDELFGGYPSFQDIPRMVKLLSPFNIAPGLGRLFRRVSAPVLKRLTSPKYAGLLEYGGTYGGAYLLRRGFFMPWELPEILGDKITREGWDELKPLMKLEQTTHGVMSERVKVSALEMNWYMRNQLLRDADWAGMAHSLEIRVPFVDVELIRRIAPLLTETFPGKRDMARTPRRPLPWEILNRRKTGFAVPVREWLTQGNGRQCGERGLRGWAKQVMEM
ncbi:MAG: asparagine synthase (glutamine-hydrolyzing) [Gammaproteobacteria bacterium]|nr:MAG: asparagine synthase (glutamine-hydrolyzing) [Gammaproteobacteria bacterium]